MTQEIAVITGAGRGLGLAMARRFAQSGRHVVIAEHNTALGEAAASALRGEGLAASFEALDVREPAQSQALVDSIARALGPIGVWVNNAGISRLGAAETLSKADWDDSIAVMLSGTFYCSQAAGRHMLANGRGVIVNIASVTGLMHESGRAAYSTAKAGVIALTEALGVEWARRGVRVVGIAPGRDRDGAADRSRWPRRPRDVGTPHADAAPRHARRNCRSRALSQQQRGLVHRRRNAARRWRLGGVSVVLSIQPQLFGGNALSRPAAGIGHFRRDLRTCSRPASSRVGMEVK
jgi:NAD(P)-dependent dehydrogenase (short-subunit alcohol dehydrogenase family)